MTYMYGLLRYLLFWYFYLGGIFDLWTGTDPGSVPDDPLLFTGGGDSGGEVLPEYEMERSR